MSTFLDVVVHAARIFEEQRRKQYEQYYMWMRSLPREHRFEQYACYAVVLLRGAAVTVIAPLWRLGL